MVVNLWRKASAVFLVESFSSWELKRPWAHVVERIIDTFIVWPFINPLTEDEITNSVFLGLGLDRYCFCLRVKGILPCCHVTKVLFLLVLNDRQQSPNHTERPAFDSLSHSYWENTGLALPHHHLQEQIGWYAHLSEINLLWACHYTRFFFFILWCLLCHSDPIAGTAEGVERCCRIHRLFGQKGASTLLHSLMRMCLSVLYSSGSSIVTWL